MGDPLPDFGSAKMTNWHDLLEQPHSALFWGDNTWQEGTQVLLLHEPVRVFTAEQPGLVPPLLDAAESEAQRGRYVVGYLAYEAAAGFDLPTHPPPKGVPLVWLASYPPAHVRALPRTVLCPSPEAAQAENIAVRLNVTAEEYQSAVDRIKELIAAGHTYQVNYTCHARFSLTADPLAYFLTLARSHPVPYAAYLNLGSARILSLSPELFLKRRGQTLETRPMKGTRPRGRTLQEDNQLAKELVTSEKDRAENVMILDMMRNDLGKVCQVGTVEVPAMFTGEKYRSVWQMTSTALGRVSEHATLAEMLAATFPGASVTGAPKRRTMEIIRDLEPEPRGPYTGTIVLRFPQGDFTCNVAIRTLVHCDGTFDLGIGSGIVWDSHPQRELEETLLKSRFAFVPLGDLRLWETMLLAQSGDCAFQREHLQRLARSALYWDFPFDTAGVQQRLREFAQAATALPCVVRLELDQEGGLHLSSRALEKAPCEPVRLLLSARRTNSHDRFLFHKTNQRRLYDQEREQALGQGFFEAIFCNERGNLTEGAISNLFLRSGRNWLTPPVEDGLLAGVWRQHFLRQTNASECSVPLGRLAQAEEIVIGNSVRGAVRVGAIYDAAERRPIWSLSAT